MTPESNDAELLAAFHRQGSQEAFAMLARRYAGLLYHAALRRSGCAAIAEEAAQNALAILARKAPSLKPSPTLAPWLHRTVCYEAQKLRRNEHRHDQRMKHLHERTPFPETPVPPEYAENLSRCLDEEINALREADRQVVLLRYSEGWTFEEMAERFGGQAAAWRQRGSRALARLRSRLARRGVAVTTAALASGLSAAFTTPAPAAVVLTLTTAPIPIAASLSWNALALHTIHTMKLKQSVIAVTVLVSALAPLGYQAVAVSRAKARTLDLEATAIALEAEVAARRLDPDRSARGCNCPGCQATGSGTARPVRL